MAKIVTQLSVHMENRPGALAELTGELVDAGVNIQAVSVPYFIASDLMRAFMLCVSPTRVSWSESRLA